MTTVPRAVHPAMPSSFFSSFLLQVGARALSLPGKVTTDPHSRLPLPFTLEREAGRARSPKGGEVCS